MKSISFEDIKALKISGKECFEWANEMIKNKNKYHLPTKTSMKFSIDSFCNIMPSRIIIENFREVMGVKIVTRYPRRIPSLEGQILLIDFETGETLAIMDGTWITAMRTGAVATHSILTFSKRNWNTIGLIGLGNVARSTLLILLSVYKEKFKVKLLRYKDQANIFIDRFKSYENVSFEIVDTVEECIKNSDIILSCVTYIQNNIALNEWFDKGVTVIPVHTRGFLNCDLFFDKVFADDKEHVKGFVNYIKFKKFAEVSSVVNGNAFGRENDDERIIIYNNGISIHDINYAGHIYKIMYENKDIFNKLPDISMNVPNTKFWV